MKTLLLILVLLSSSLQAKPYDPIMDIMIVQGIDWRQTLYIAKNKAYTELNPLLGRHPSIRAINTYFVLTTALILGIHKVLPYRQKRIFSTTVLIGLELNILRNQTLGIKVIY